MVKGTSVSETVDGNCLSVPIEAGWGFKLLSYRRHLRRTARLRPWCGYEADDVSNDAHDVTFEGKDNIRTKLGVKTYAFGKNSGGFSPYVELNWIYNTETCGVTMSNVTVEQVGAEDQGEVRAGVDWRLNDAFTVWGHFGITSGSDGYSNRSRGRGIPRKTTSKTASRRATARMPFVMLPEAEGKREKAGSSRTCLLGCRDWDQAAGIPFPYAILSVIPGRAAPSESVTECLSFSEKPMV